MRVEMTRIIMLCCGFFAFLFGTFRIDTSLWAGDQLCKNQAQLSLAFQQHVNNGLVDYASIKEDENLNAYLLWLAQADTSQIKTPNEEMAFWVNAYNALAIKGVIDNAPVEKIVDVPGFFNEQQHSIAGSELTLNQIEKGIIYKKFDEPRLHFVLVCAALSCPKLASSAYSGSDILERMEKTTRAFLNNPERNRIDRDRKTLYLSQIFNWYKSDFMSDGKSVVDFLKPYFAKDARDFLTRNAVRIDYLEYDWSLNDVNK